MKFEKFLGKGSFGSVSLFEYSRPRDTGKTVYTAVKTSDYDHAASLYKEFKILSQFKGCSRIVQCYENRVIKNHDGEGEIEYMMLMEYAALGCLGDFMKRYKEKKFPDPLIREFTRMILKGLATIHAHGYIHCDLKPENILVFPSYAYNNGISYELKISDFGLSQRDGNSNWWSHHHPFAGTPIYMSLESISHGETGKGLDLWSLGCVVLEMYTGKRPWWHKKYNLKDLKKGQEPLIPSDLPCDAKHFIMTCFAFETDERTDALRLLRHSFLRRDLPRVTVKKDNNYPKDLALKLQDIRQKLEEIRSMKYPERPNFVLV